MSSTPADEIIRRLRQQLLEKDGFIRAIKSKCSQYEGVLQGMSAQLRSAKDRNTTLKRQLAQQEERLLQLQAQVKERDDSIVLLTASTKHAQDALQVSSNNDTILHLNNHIKNLDVEKQALQSQFQEVCARHESLLRTLTSIQRENTTLRSELSRQKDLAANADKLVAESREMIRQLNQPRTELHERLVTFKSDLTRLISDVIPYPRQVPPAQEQPRQQVQVPEEPQQPPSAGTAQEQMQVTPAQEQMQVTPAQEQMQVTPRQVQVATEEDSPRQDTDDDEEEPVRRRVVRVPMPFMPLVAFLNAYDPNNELNWRGSDQKVSTFRSRLIRFNATRYVKAAVSKTSVNCRHRRCASRSLASVLTNLSLPVRNVKVKSQVDTRVADEVLALFRKKYKRGRVKKNAVPGDVLDGRIGI